MLPLWFRKFLVDFVETGLAVLLALNVAIPSSLDEGLALLSAVVVGVVAAAVSAFRRAIPDFLAWLRDKLSVPSESGT